MKIGSGTVTLANTDPDFMNGLSVGVKINAGTLRFDAHNNLNATAAVKLNGGTLSTGIGYGHSVGTLSATGTGSKIELGTTSTHTLTFASFDNTGFTSMTIDGWQGSYGSTGTKGKIVVTNPAGLTAGVLAGISFTGFPGGAQLISGNELSPVPEPAAVLGLAAVGLGLARAVRRRRP